MRATMLLGALAIAATACSAPPPTWAPLGAESYRTATICTSAELAPILSDAAERWHAADPAIAMTVRVDAEAEAAFPSDPTCDISARFVHTLTDADGSPFAGLSAPGRMQLWDSTTIADLLSDTVTHELGHFLMGLDAVAHSADPSSVMYAYIDEGRTDAPDGEKAILPSDLAKLDAPAR